MRILIVNEALWGAGGVETYLASIVPALQRAGHEVGVLHDNPMTETGPQRIAPEGTWRVGVRDEGIDRALGSVRAFAPDVCFSHNMRALSVDARLTAEWPLVKMMHGHFGTCVSSQKAFTFPGVVACTRTFGPGCLAYYLPRHCGRVNPIVMAQQYRWGLEQRSLFGNYRAIVVASCFMRDEYLRAGVAPASLHAIPLFAPPDDAAAPAEDDSRSIDVLFVGRMTSLKGPDLLLEAARHASIRLGRTLTVVFAGEGPERDRLAEQAASDGVDARFSGWVTPQERDRLLRQAAIIAVPSRWPEPFGLVGLEGGVFGTPAVAFDTGGIGDWLVDGANGRLVDAARGAAGFGDALADILENPALRRELAAGARAASARLSLANHMARLIPVLEQAAAPVAATS